MECRLIRLGNGDVECERCKKNFGNFKDRSIPAGMGKKCNHHSVVKTFKRFAKSAGIASFIIMTIHNIPNVMNVVVFYW